MQCTINFAKSTEKNSPKNTAFASFVANSYKPSSFPLIVLHDGHRLPTKLWAFPLFYCRLNIMNINTNQSQAQGKLAFAYPRRRRSSAAQWREKKFTLNVEAVKIKMGDDAGVARIWSSYWHCEASLPTTSPGDRISTSRSSHLHSTHYKPENSRAANSIEAAPWKTW